MTTLHLTLTAKAPLVFSERRPNSQFRPSAPYVSGSVLRGALARQMQDAGEPTGDGSDFAALFTDGAAPLFRHAYPAPRVLPATAQTCKATPGFTPDGHGVVDGLLDRLCWETMDAGAPMPFACLPRCAHTDGDKRCRGRMEAYSGFYRWEGAARVHATPPRSLTTRVGINRARRVAEEGLLYSPLVIREAEWDPATGGFRDTAFRGSVVVQTDAQAALVRQHLGELTHVGSGAARGFGQVTVTFDDAAPPEEALAARVAGFNRRLEERSEAWSRTVPGRKAILPLGPHVTVLLLSEAALRPDGWTPTVRLEPSLLGPGFKGAELVRCYANPEQRGGWNTAWGLPKDTETVAARGSVYVYRMPGPADADLLLALADLEEQGVGERRQEGFGQVRVCDEFHQEVQGGKA